MRAQYIRACAPRCAALRRALAPRADAQDVPHAGVGGARRMQMHSPDAQHEVLIEAVENHMPQVIVVDEIGTVLEAEAARTIAQRGVQLVATAHGHVLSNVIKNPSLVGLLGGVESVTLGDEEARRRGVAKTVLERQGPPTFGVAVEMLAIGRWRVHLDVAAAVDALLAGRTPPAQLRYCAADGSVRVEEDEGGEGEGAGAGGAATLQPGGAASALPLPGARVGSGGSGGDGGAAAASPAVRLYCHGIDTEALGRVVAALGMTRAVALTPALEDADAVLALRSRLGRQGADDWLRLTARQRGLPLYAIKTDTLSQLVRALKTILGVPAGAGGDDAALLAAAEAPGAAGAGAAQGAAAARAGNSAARGAAVDAADALEEVRARARARCRCRLACTADAHVCALGGFPIRRAWQSSRLSSRATRPWSCCRARRTSARRRRRSSPRTG